MTVTLTLFHNTDKEKEAAAAAAAASGLPSVAEEGAAHEAFFPRAVVVDEDAREALEVRRRAARCFFVLLGLAMAMGCFVVAAHLVSEAHRPSYYRGFCRVPYLRDDTMLTGDWSMGDRPAFAKLQELARAVQQQGARGRPRAPIDVDIGDDDAGLMALPVQRPASSSEDARRPTFELDYELDLDYNEVETLELPELSRGRYMHDFKANMTAIVDVDGGRCFLLPLNRSEVPRPRSLFEVITNMKKGLYDINMDEIRHDTVVMLPPVQNLQPFGSFISDACGDKVTYQLQKASSVLRIKREAGEADHEVGVHFSEFTGRNLITYNILNLADI